MANRAPALALSGHRAPNPLRESNPEFAGPALSLYRLHSKGPFGARFLSSSYRIPPWQPLPIQDERCRLKLIVPEVQQYMVHLQRRRFWYIVESGMCRIDRCTQYPAFLCRSESSTAIKSENSSSKRRTKISIEFGVCSWVRDARRS